MVHPISQVLDLDALLLVITGPVLSSCPVAPVIVTLTMARRAQWEGSTDLAGYVLILVTMSCAVTPTTAPGCVVKIVKTLSSFSTGTGTKSTSTLSPTLYTIATFIPVTTTPVSTEC